jgi:hypothetical protein
MDSQGDIASQHGIFSGFVNCGPKGDAPEARSFAPPLFELAEPWPLISVPIATLERPGDVYA